MAYITQFDFKRQIQTDNLTQIIGGDTSVLNNAILTGIAEATSYLIQKYDCSQEFTDMIAWNYTTAYNALQRIYLDALPYDPTAGTYALNVLTLQSGNVYLCTTPVISPGVFSVGNWQLLGPQYTIFTATLPQPQFSLYNPYLIGTQVFWKNNIYTCKLNVIGIAPDDVTNGLQYWGVGTPYNIAAGTSLSNSVWSQTDGRNQQMVVYCIDLALYHIHSRIAPRNIPELRVKRYDDALNWFKMAGQGKITAALPLLQPNSGQRIRYGGNTKNINTY